MKNLPFIFPLCGLVLGILYAEFSPIVPVSLTVRLGGVLLFILLLAGLFHFKRYTVLIFLLFIRIGIFLADYQNQKTQLSEFHLNQLSWAKVKIEDVYKPSVQFRKYKAQLISIDSVTQKDLSILLYWKKEYPMLHPSDEVWIETKILEVNKPLNPYQFDYSKYLKRQNIQYRAYANSSYGEIQKGNSFQQRISTYKRSMYQKLMDSGYEKNSADIIGAMILGDRTEMDEEIEETYRKTGVVHILSISGLHIMIVYMMFYFLLYPMVYLKNGKIIRILVSLFLIWSYVILVGFQPPILRSALMITVFHVTITFHRKPNIYHTLTVTAFILLCFRTNFLFDIGFQLSYMAVFFIVYLHPIYQKIFKPRNYFSKLTVGFMGTSISAQLGTFPIAAYYFHQSSGLFLAGNMVMILASNFMIGGGMLSILFLEMGIHFPFLIYAFNQFIHFCNAYMEWLSEFDFLVFERISIQIGEVFLLLLMGIGLKFLYPKPKFSPLMGILSLVFLFSFQRNIRIQELKNKKELIIFHQYKNSVIGIRNGPQLDVFIRNEYDSLLLHQYLIKPYEINENIQNIQYYSMDKIHHSYYQKTENIFQFGNQNILLLDENIQEIPKGIQFVVIQNNSKILKDSLIQNVEIIVDGSNYPNYSLESDYPIWKTREKGAKIIRLP